MDTIDVIKNWIDKESQVLDLGCGDGKILNILTKELGVTSLGVETVSYTHLRAHET